MQKREFLKTLFCIPAVSVCSPAKAKEIADSELPKELIVQYSPYAVDQAQLIDVFQDAPYSVRFVPVEYMEEPIKIFSIK